MVSFIKKLRKRKNNIRGEKRTKGTRESIHSLLSGKVKIKQLFPKFTLAKWLMHFPSVSDDTEMTTHTEKKRKTQTRRLNNSYLKHVHSWTNTAISRGHRGVHVSKHSLCSKLCLWQGRLIWGVTQCILSEYFLWGLWVMHSHQSSIFHTGSGLLLWPCLEELGLSQGEHSSMTHHVCKPYDLSNRVDNRAFQCNHNKPTQTKDKLH